MILGANFVHGMQPSAWRVPSEGQVLVMKHSEARSGGQMFRFGCEAPAGHQREPSGSSSATLSPSYLSSRMVAKRYDVIEELGTGSFGHVQLVQDRRTGHQRACKIVGTTTLQPGVPEMVRMEVEILRSLDH